MQERRRQSAGTLEDQWVDVVWWGQCRCQEQRAAVAKGGGTHLFYGKLKKQYMYGAKPQTTTGNRKTHTPIAHADEHDVPRHQVAGHDVHAPPVAQGVGLGRDELRQGLEGPLGAVLLVLVGWWWSGVRWCVFLFPFLKPPPYVCAWGQ